MLSGVRLSPKIAAEMLIVVTSFAMPAIDMGTTPARWMILWAFKILSKPSAKNINSRELAQNHTKRGNSWHCQKENGLRSLPADEERAVE